MDTCFIPFQCFIETNKISNDLVVFFEDSAAKTGVFFKLVTSSLHPAQPVLQFLAVPNPVKPAWL